MADANPMRDTIRLAGVIALLTGLLVGMAALMAAIPASADELRRPSATATPSDGTGGDHHADALRGHFWRPAGSDAARPAPALEPRRWSPEQDDARTVRSEPMSTAALSVR